jgi:Leucine-rich repeat (LRR) protein
MFSKIPLVILISCVTFSVLLETKPIFAQEEQASQYIESEKIPDLLSSGELEKPISNAARKLLDLGATLKMYNTDGRWWINLEGTTEFSSWNENTGPVITEREAKWKGKLADLKILGQLSQVHLELNYLQVDKALLDTIGSIGSIKSLSISRGTLRHDDQLFRGLATTDKLKSLTVDTFFLPILPAAIDSITNIGSLESLTIRTNAAMLEGSLDHIGRLSKLKKLSLPNVDFASAPAGDFHQLVQLENLELRGCQSVSKLISGAKSLENLKVLDLSSSTLTFLDFQMITKALPGLTEFKFLRPTIQPETWKRIVDYLKNDSRLPDLNKLILDQRSTNHHQLACLVCARPEVKIRHMIVRGGISTNGDFHLNPTEMRLLNAHQGQDTDNPFDLSKARSDSENFEDRILLEDQIDWIQSKLDNDSPLDIAPLIGPLVSHADYRALPTLIQLVKRAETADQIELQTKLKKAIASFWTKRTDRNSLVLAYMDRGAARELEQLLKLNFAGLRSWWNDEMRHQVMSHAAFLEVSE